jgi:hypothetical protein
MRRAQSPAFLMVLLILFLVASIGCSKGPSDEAVAKDIQKKIAEDPITKDAPVNVSAQAGKVTLSGKVKSQEVRDKIEQIARQQPGTTAVDDQTTAVPPPAAAALPAAPPPAAAAQPAAQPEAAAATPPANPPPPPAPPKPKPIVIPAGTVLTVKTTQSLSSKNSQEGQTFLASLAQPVSAGGKRALPVGATVNGTVVAAKKKGKIKGEGQLALTLNSISVRGHTYPIRTETLDSTVKGKGKRTAVTTGGGAAAGALIGGLAGGGKGAGIGALAGAGAGLVGGAFTGNKQIEIPAETPLSFTLTAPLKLPPSSE